MTTIERVSIEGFEKVRENSFDIGRTSRVTTVIMYEKVSTLCNG
jgi:hypothetical protein